jgi:hypothetical protein
MGSGEILRSLSLPQDDKTKPTLFHCHSEPKAKNLTLLNMGSGEILWSLSLPQDDKTRLAPSPCSGLRLTPQDDKTKPALPQGQNKAVTPQG